MIAVDDRGAVSAADLLQAASRLSPLELEAFLRSTKMLRAKPSTNLSHGEAELLLAVHRSVPDKTLHRYRELSQKCRTETITDAEYQELLRLVEVVEKAQVERLENLIALAQLRGTTLHKLMKDMGLRPPPADVE